MNPAAFTRPASGTIGDFPRNGLRNIYGSIDQTDLALRRRFNLTERVKLDVRAEYFNIFNHPMFGAPGPSTGENGLSNAPYAFWGYGPTAYPVALARYTRAKQRTSPWAAATELADRTHCTQLEARAPDSSR